MRTFEFYYSTLARMVDEGWDGVNPSADRMRQAIIDASLRINALTEQEFAPHIHNPITFRSEPEYYIEVPRSLPIIKIDRLVIDTEQELTVDEDFTHFSRERKIHLLAERDNRVRMFCPPSDDYFRTDFYGTTGWLDNPKEVSTTTVTEIASGASEVELTSIADLEEFDILLIGSNLKLTITGVDAATKKVTFDALPNITAPVAIGANVLCYGRVPAGIVRVTAALVKQALEKELDAAAGDIISETTDNYTYRLSDRPERAFNTITGSEEADRILQEYSRPGLNMFAP